MDCGNCRHLTVVGLHETGPWFMGFLAKPHRTARLWTLMRVQAMDGAVLWRTHANSFVSWMVGFSAKPQRTARLWMLIGGLVLGNTLM